MSINTKSALSNNKSYVAPADVDPLIHPSTNKRKTNIQPTPKDKIKERIANIYTTSYTDNVWKNPQKFTSKNNTLANSNKSIIHNTTLPNVEKPTSTTKSYSISTSLTNARNYTYTTPYSQISSPINHTEIINTEKLAAIYRTTADNAYNKRMIFKIVGGYDPIRRALCDRGWIEKLDPSWFPHINKLSDTAVLQNAKKGNDYERVFLSRLIEKYPAFFVWQHRKFYDEYLEAMPIRCYLIRPKNVDFTTKVGLIGIAEQDHWFKFSGLCGMSYPRFYRLKNPEERTEFIEDYRRTQCRNLVRFVTENISTPFKLANMKTGTIFPAETLTYAIEYMEGQLSDWEYLTLDKVSDNQGNKFKYDEWIKFFNNSENILRGRCKFKATAKRIKEFATIAKEYSDIIYERRPDYKWDGVGNIWILKPAFNNRGIGIVVKKCLDDILNMSADNCGSNYIVQKYIESAWTTTFQPRTNQDKYQPNPGLRRAPMSINTRSALSKDKSYVVPSNAKPLILPSTNKRQTNMQPTPKDKIKERIANIYKTSYTDNVWKNPKKFTSKNNASASAQKSTNRNYTSPNAQKNIIRKDPSPNAQKSSIKNYTSAAAQKIPSKSNTSINAKKSIKKASNNSTYYKPKPRISNTTLPNVAKPISTTNNYSIINYSSPIAEKSPSKFNTSTYSQKSIRRSNSLTNSQKSIRRSTSLTNARQAFIRNKYSTYDETPLVDTNNSLTNARHSFIRNKYYANAQKPLITNNAIYARNYTSPYSQTSLNRYGSTTYAQRSHTNRTEIANTQRLATMYRTKADNAYKNRMIFKIVGDYHPIRRALCDRGWIEKLDPSWFAHITKLSDTVVLKNVQNGNDYERVYLSRLIEKYPAFFVWQPRWFYDQYVEAMPIRSYLIRPDNVDFTTKVGLIGIAEQDHWFKFSGLCGMNYPRFYRMKNPEEQTEFIEDYRRTQCRNLVRFVTENISTPNKLADMKTGTIFPAVTLKYAIEYMEGTLSDWEHLTLDKKTDNQGNKFNYNEWVQFCNSSESILRGRCKFKASAETIKEFATIAKEYLDIIYERRPDYLWDGVGNIWILKPANNFRGIGIVVKKYLDDILSWATKNYASNYIVQKYIERPLLIYNTKFDIRQHMIVSIGKTDASIWMYKDCYFRFSSQIFSLDNLNESIHLTNNSVQINYQVDKRRDRRLPAHHMWSLEQFLNYLKWSNIPVDIWRNKIYAGFKENLIAVVLASFEETQFVPNTYELYGCDFMLDENYNPILIEINHTPDMYASTPVTGRLCPMVLYDIVKVVVDVPNNPNAPTGLFECVHRISYKSTFDPKDRLDVSGKAMKIHQESLDTSENAIAIPQVTTSTASGKATAISQVAKAISRLSTSGKATAIPQVGTTGKATAIPQVSNSAKALTVPQESNSDKAMTTPQESLNNIGKNVIIRQPSLNLGIKNMTIQEQEAKKEEEKISKQRFYQKLFAKRLQLTKFLKCLNSPESP